MSPLPEFAIAEGKVDMIGMTRRTLPIRISSAKSWKALSTISAHARRELLSHKDLSGRYGAVHSQSGDRRERNDAA